MYKEGESNTEKKKTLQGGGWNKEEGREQNNAKSDFWQNKKPWGTCRLVGTAFGGDRGGKNSAAPKVKMTHNRAKTNNLLPAESMQASKPEKTTLGSLRNENTETKKFTG